MSQFQDRGGLSYGIDVRDGFSTNLRNFRTEVEKARQAWRAFRRDFRNTATQTTRIRKDVEATTKALRDRSRQMDRIRRSEREFAREQGKIATAVRENTQAMKLQDIQAKNRIRSLNTETRSVRRLTSAYRQLNQARRAVPRGLPTSRPSSSPNRSILGSTNARQRAADFDRLDTAMGKSGNTANRISFTFRRLFGILAAFAAARAAVTLFNQLTASAVRLNAELEQSVLGVAGLLTALGTVSDPFGVIADDADRLNASQTASRRQLELLRGEALKTSASFQELADTFQIALAPGFQAGLDLDEIRRLTVRISQAASAIGLPQNQLPEEIRSLLTGTITPRTTRIATALGITNEDIRNAKEAGELVEFLDERFGAFAIAGEAALKNFSTILINLRDGLGQILRIGGFEFFNELKAELNDLLGIVAQVDEEGQIVFNEDAINVVREIGAGLRDAVEEAGALGDALDLRDARNIAKLIGRSISAAAKTAGPIIESLLTVLSAAGQVVEILTSIGVVNELVLRTLGYVLAINAALRTILVIVGTLKSVGFLGAISVQLKLIRGLIFGITQGAISWRVATLTLARSLLTLGPLLAGIALAYEALRGRSEEVTVASEDLQRSMAELPVSISNANAELEEQKQIIRELEDRFQRASNSFAVASATSGLSGVLRKQVEQQIELQQKTRDLESQTASEATRLSQLRDRLAVKRIEAEERVQEISKAQNGVTDGLAVRLKVVQSLQEDIVGLREREAALADREDEAGKRRLASLKAQREELIKQRREAVEATARDVALALRAQQREESSFIQENPKQFLDVAGRNLDALLRGQLDDLVGTGELFPNADQINEANSIVADLTDKLKETQRVEAEINGIIDQQNQLRQSQIQLAISQSRVRALESRAAAEEFIGPFFGRTSQSDFILSTEESVPSDIDSSSIINEENTRLRTQVRLRDQIKDTVDRLGNIQQAQAQAQLETAQEDLRFLRLRNAEAVKAIEFTQSQNERELSKAELDRDRLKDKESLTEQDRETLRLLDDQILLLKQEGTALSQQLDVLEERNSLVENQQLFRVEEAQEAVNKTQETFSNVIEGFRDGLVEANKSVLTSYEIAAQATLRSVQQFSNLIADTIVDAFDPTSDSTIEQRIGSFLQGIARMLIQLTVQAVLLRTILSSFPGFFGAASGGPVPAVSAAMGGLIQSFQTAKGLASGGSVGRSPIRPAGLPASDTTPAWLTPGEYVVKRSAVAAYGSDVMKAINNTLIDPTSLRSLAGLRSRRASAQRRPRLGYADGGLVSGSPGASVPAGSEGQEESPMPLVAIPANDATIESLFNGGKNALYAFFQSNQGKIKAALSIPRS